MLILSDLGAGQILNSYFKKIEPAGGNNLLAKLFVNDVVPTDTDTAASYTEATGGGYEPKTLAVADCTVSNVDGIMQAEYPQQSFIFTGPLTTNSTVYGVYVVDADGVLICAERLATPYEPMNAGDTIGVTPKFRLSKGAAT